MEELGEHERKECRKRTLGGSYLHPAVSARKRQRYGTVEQMIGSQHTGQAYYHGLRSRRPTLDDVQVASVDTRQGKVCVSDAITSMTSAPGPADEEMADTIAAVIAEKVLLKPFEDLHPFIGDNGGGNEDSDQGPEGLDSDEDWDYVEHPVAPGHHMFSSENADIACRIIDSGDVRAMLRCLTFSTSVLASRNKSDESPNCAVEMNNLLLQILSKTMVSTTHLPPDSHHKGKAYETLMDLFSCKEVQQSLLELALRSESCRNAYLLLYLYVRVPQEFNTLSFSTFPHLMTQVQQLSDQKFLAVFSLFVDPIFYIFKTKDFGGLMTKEKWDNVSRVDSKKQGERHANIEQILASDQWLHCLIDIACGRSQKLSRNHGSTCDLLEVIRGINRIYYDLRIDVPIGLSPMIRQVLREKKDASKETLTISAITLNRIRALCHMDFLLLGPSGIPVHQKYLELGVALSLSSLVDSLAWTCEGPEHEGHTKCLQSHPLKIQLLFTIERFCLVDSSMVGENGETAPTETLREGTAALLSKLIAATIGSSDDCEMHFFLVATLEKWIRYSEAMAVFAEEKGLLDHTVWVLKSILCPERLVKKYVSLLTAFMKWHDDIVPALLNELTSQKDVDEFVWNVEDVDGFDLTLCSFLDKYSSSAHGWGCLATSIKAVQTNESAEEFHNLFSNLANDMKLNLSAFRYFDFIMSKQEFQDFMQLVENNLLAAHEFIECLVVTLMHYDSTGEDIEEIRLLTRVQASQWEYLRCFVAETVNKESRYIQTTMVFLSALVLANTKQTQCGIIDSLEAGLCATPAIKHHFAYLLDVWLDAGYLHEDNPTIKDSGKSMEDWICTLERMHSRYTPEQCTDTMQ